MRTKKELKKAHPELAELIDTLWPIAMMLFRERTAGEFTRSVISPDIETGFSAGLKNLIEGNNSGAVGEGLNTKSFLEILIGSYATIATDQDPEAWVATDRLLGIGNGSDDENRSMGMEVFKSGLIKLFNAIEIGDYAHGSVDPVNGTLRYTSANGLEIRHGGVWVSLISTVDKSCEFSFKFEVAEAFTFVCPAALKFTTMERQQVNAPTLSVALNTNMAQFDPLIITPDAVGLVILKGVYL